MQDKILEIKVDVDKAIRKIVEYQNGIDSLKAKEQELQKMRKEGAIGEQEYREMMVRTTMARKENTAVINDLSKAIQNEAKQNQQAEGSIASLRAQLSNATRAFDSLSKAERDGAKGQEFAKHINDLTKEIKSAEEGTQRFYRNVGNYENALNSALSKHAPFISGLKNIASGAGGLTESFKAAKAGVSSLSKQLLQLLANPIVAIVAAVAGAFMALYAVFQKLVSVAKSNEEQNAKLEQAMAPLKVIGDALQRTLEGLAETFVNVASAVMKGVTAFTDFFGITKNLSKQSEEYANLEKRKLDLANETRKAAEEASKSEMEISELKNKVAQKDKYSVEERKKMLQDAIDKEEAISKKKKELSEERVAILEIEAGRTKNAAAFEDKLSEARIAVNKATTEYNDNTKKLQGQLSSFNEQEAADLKAKEEKRKADYEKRIEMLKEAKQKERDAIQQAEDALIELIDNQYEQQRQQTEKNYSRQIESLRERLKTEKNLTEVARNAINETILALEKQKVKEIEKINGDFTKSEEEKTKASNEKTIAEEKLNWDNKIAEAKLKGQETLQLELQRRKEELDALQKLEEESDAAFKARQLMAEQAYQDTYSAIKDKAKSEDEKRVQKEIAIQKEKEQAFAQITSAIGGLFETLGEENTEFAKLSKVLALAEIAINTGKAISAGIAQSQSVPFPGNIAAIATTVASVIAGVTSAIKTVKSVKLATGGLVTGAGSGTSDSIPARLSAGESVINAQSTSMFAPLLSSINLAGGGVPINTVQQSNNAIGEDMLARAVAKGVASMPNPIVSVKEINDVSLNVKVIETISKL